MTHNLLLNYGLYRKMEIYVSITATGDLYTVFFFFTNILLVMHTLTIFKKRIPSIK